ncbi:MAG: primary-amine oxidase [Dehalococcoidia bacterium]
MSHPLDPLSADEIRQATAILRRERGVARPGWRIGAITLLEPAKEVANGHRRGDPVHRAARATVWNTRTGVPSIALLDLTGDALTAWTDHPGHQANVTVDEWHECDAAMRAHPDVVAALARRGIDDPSLALIDVWTYGGDGAPFPGRRVGWCDVWLRNAPGGNPYAHHLTGLRPIVDLNTMELLALDDEPGPGIKPVQGDYDPAHVPGLQTRSSRRALHITQPDGVSFTLDGHALAWENWRLRIGFTPREGLVLHQVGWAQSDGAGTRVRPIAHRMSFAEMVVPYRDPTPTHADRTAFDIGEWGLGFMTTSLELGCDCLGEIRYLDAVVHDTAGEPEVIRNAVCLHEEDNGVLWKHVDGHAGAQVRRMRRMVISTHVTVANYEYLAYWRLYEDGNIECEVRATGIMVTTPFDGDPPPYGTVVDAQTYAPIHQHFIVARLDLDVDGPGNTVVTTESAVADGIGLVQRSTPIMTEGGFDQDWATQRAWKITNPARRNAHGTPVAYKLAPSATVPPLLTPDSPLLRRAAVIGHQLWVTPHDAEERWPCGEFVVQSGEDAGLPVWTAAGRGVEDTDVVLWYVFGIHHVPRVEDWPVMPADTVSFWLKPAGFFDANPSLDVAP